MMKRFNSNWCILEDQFDINNNKRYEGMFTQGSGYFSMRGSLEESPNPFLKADLLGACNVTAVEPNEFPHKWGVYVPGITGMHPNVNQEIINLPWFAGFELEFESESFSMEHSRISDYRRWLDMRDGVLMRSFVWNTSDGNMLSVEMKRYLHAAYPNLCVQEIVVKSKKAEGELSFISAIDGNVKTNGHDHFVSTAMEAFASNRVGFSLETDMHDDVLIVSELDCNYDLELVTQKTDRRIQLSGSVKLNKGSSVKFRKISAITSSRDMMSENYVDKALQVLDSTKKMSMDELYKAHADIWEHRWDSSDIYIEGDEEAQRSVRFSLYHLLRSLVRNDDRVSICAKGHAGDAYFGRYFWDTEIFVLPYYIYTDPEAAKNLIRFRYNSLDGARENAKRYGYSGARYPWESSVRGDEQCHLWQFSDNELHVTADVIYGLWHYYKATDDLEFMIKYGAEMLIETSRYWMDRIDKFGDGSYGFSGVMGPDEYTPFTKNNAFTMRLVKFNLEKTHEIFDELESNAPNERRAILERFYISGDELQSMKAMAEKLEIPFDPDRNLVLQSDDFEDLAVIDIEEVWKDRSRHFIHYAQQEKLYRTKCIKQADVLALMQLFPEEFSQDQKLIAYDYYEPLTTHDSSLSPSSHGLIATWIDKDEEAQKYFSKALSIDMTMDSYGAAEGIHIANCGGVWQMIVHGFAGMRSAIQSDELVFSPKLPSKWKKLSFKTTWKGSQYVVDIFPQHYTYQAV